VNALLPLWVPLSLAALAALSLIADAVVSTTDPRFGRALGWSVAGALGALLGATFMVDATGPAAHGAFEASAWTLGCQRLFLAAGALAALGGLDDVARTTPRRTGEHWTLLLVSLAGMTLIPGARDLVLMVVAFELMGVPLYVLTAYAKTGGEGTAPEAAIKLYLVGATSSALTLFGLAMVTGMAGGSSLAAVSSAPLTPLTAVGVAFMLGGVAYKVGIAPFHMWVPDAYEGARAPFVAFLSVAPKAAGLAAIAVIFFVGMPQHRAQWAPALALLALLSMAVGNVLALRQTDTRRLLGYSGVAQMGYVLLAMLAGDAFGLGMTLFFLLAYLFTNMGAFFVAHAVAEATGGHEIARMAGLAQRAPGLAAALLAFVLSLAGIPFVAGFWAKLYVFVAAWEAGLGGLVIAALALAVLGLFYYLRILQAAYMREPEGEVTAVKGDLGLRVAIGLCLVGVVGAGLWPGPFVDASMQAARALLAR